MAIYAVASGHFSILFATGGGRFAIVSPRRMKKILVIDDEQNIRDTISTLLSARGFDVVTAEDGLAGVKEARAHKPDLVISDIIMEPVDGFMTLSIIKQLPGTARIPFIMITGDRDLDTMRKGLVLGADDYLNKPFSPTELLETVNTQLKRREADIESAVEQVKELKELLGAPPKDAIGDALEDIRDSGERIAGMESIDSSAKGLGARIAEKARGLRRNIAHTALLTQIEVVAGNPDTLNVLRAAAACELVDVVDAECVQVAEKQDRLDDLRLHLARCNVAISAVALARIAEELVGNAFAYSPPGSDVSVKCRVADQSVQLSFENKIQRRAPRGATGESGGEESNNAWPDFESGLGLRFVRRLVQIHGGNFGVVPRSQTVVAVQVELPLVAAELS